MSETSELSASAGIETPRSALETSDNPCFNWFAISFNLSVLTGLPAESTIVPFDTLYPKPSNDKCCPDIWESFSIVLYIATANSLLSPEFKPLLSSSQQTAILSFAKLIAAIVSAFLATFSTFSTLNSVISFGFF